MSKNKRKLRRIVISPCGGFVVSPTEGYYWCNSFVDEANVKNVLLALLLSLFTLPAQAQQSGPLNDVDVCIVSVTSTCPGTPANCSIASWCGFETSTIADQNKGAGGFTIMTDDSTTLCLGGLKTVNTTMTAGGKCWPIGKSSPSGKKEQPIRANAHKVGMKASVATLVFVYYGTAP